MKRSLATRILHRTCWAIDWAWVLHAYICGKVLRLKNYRLVHYHNDSGKEITKFPRPIAISRFVKLLRLWKKYTKTKDCLSEATLRKYAFDELSVEKTIGVHLHIIQCEFCGHRSSVYIAQWAESLPASLEDLEDISTAIFNAIPTNTQTPERMESN